MRICYVAFQFWPSVGGSQTQAEKQARYLRQLGQDVMVVTLRHQKAWPRREMCSTFPVIRVGGWYRHDGILRVGRLGHIFADIRLFLTLWHLRRKYDLIHIFQLSSLAFVVAMIGKLTGKPVVVGVQSTGPCEPQIDAVQKERQEQMPYEAGKVCVRSEESKPEEIGGDIAMLQACVRGGRWMLNYLRQADVFYQVLSSRSYASLIQHGFRPEHLVYIPNGIDTQQFHPIWPTGVTEVSQRVVLCVARLEYAKGIDVLLHAWARMLNLPATWGDSWQPRLRLVGDGSCRAELERLAITLGIQSSVEFLGTRHDVLQLLQQAWGFVLPSRWEGMPNALLEAMACALPCIASRVSGSEDIIEQGKNGLLVEPEQPEQLAHALRLLIEDTSLAKKLGWCGYETVLDHYQLSLTVQRCLAFYRYLLAKHTCKRAIDDDTQPIWVHPEEWQLYE